MIYIFYGNSPYLISQELKKWKTAFREKHGEENLIHINDLSRCASKDLREYITARSLFAEKRLLIIEGFPFSTEKWFSWASDLEGDILANLNDAPDELFIVFSSLNPDKRKAWFKQLSKLAEKKEFTLQNEDQTYMILEKMFSGNIESQALRKLISLKGNNLEKCVSEIEKLFLTHKKIEMSSIWKYISPEFEESIFVFLDSLLEKNSKRIFSEFRNILWFTNIYAFYQSLLANLRVFLYIQFLKSQKISQSEISDIMKLWNRAFLINKQYKSSFLNIQQLYTYLLDFDKNMKFWRLVSSDEKDLSREIENIFLRFIV